MSFDSTLDAFGVDDFSKHVGEVVSYNMKDKKVKVCSRCGKAKLLEEFWTDKRMVDGRKNVCKKCTNIDRDMRRETLREETSMEVIEQEIPEYKLPKPPRILNVEECYICDKESLCVTLRDNKNVCVNCVNDAVQALIGSLK